MTTFENLISELYERQKSSMTKEGKSIISGRVYAYGTVLPFNTTSKEDINKNIGCFDTLCISSTAGESEKEIQKTKYISHEFINNTLKIKTMNKEYRIRLK
jgi:hypothetical protein